MRHVVLSHKESVRMFQYLVFAVGYGGPFTTYPIKFWFRSNFNIDLYPNKVKRRAHKEIEHRGFPCHRVKSVTKAEA